MPAYLKWSWQRSYLEVIDVQVRRLLFSDGAFAVHLQSLSAAAAMAAAGAGHQPVALRPATSRQVVLLRRGDAVHRQRPR